MNCADLEIVLCDYLDGTLAPARRAAFESHLGSCTNCAVLAEDAAAGLAFLEHVPDVHPPQELITRIMHQAPVGRSAHGTRGIRAFLHGLLAPIRQPRYVMGAMCTILSLAMMTRCAGVPVRNLKPEDLNPEHVWITLEARVERIYDRTMKTYESMRLVYEVRSELRQWREQQQEQDATAPVQTREIPVKTAPAGPGEAKPEPSP